MSIKYLIYKSVLKLKYIFSLARSLDLDRQILLLGKLASNQIKSAGRMRKLSDAEFKVFSQFGDDGIIQWLTHNIEIPNKTFIEFGVENYRESNTRFLMMNDNWSGFVLDGRKSNISQIINSEYYWKYDLLAKTAFIDKENINNLLALSGFDEEVGLLHIDIDGNDYWIWETINVISPIIVIIEYNSTFGPERSITIPYDKDFVYTQAHHSNLYYGASLLALYNLCVQKGYQFIGCNGAGNNAYFIRNDKLNDIVQPISIEQGYVASKFRQSRNSRGSLTHLEKKDQLTEIKGMPVYNTITKCIEEL